eukprot:TRINITY_DN54866_c0_g1_i1.p1 TRINITY_DN54866_c0_g1~~TRINITY_DN54866_c0_g1_i1.p1  ORF type:complete len:421 (+),score=135.86 TRINITY_DN54866_c0_g1_i1:64-1326(+)
MASESAVVAEAACGLCADGEEAPSSSVAPANAAAQRGGALCSVCRRVPFRYTCPRCEALYCGLECYREHGTQCVERFYQAQVQGELQSQRADEDERRRLERIVFEMNHLDASPDGEDDDDEDEELDDGEGGLSERRLHELLARAEAGELSAEDLNEEELRRFHSELKRGALARCLPVWEPWWERAAVVELDTMDEDAPPPHICCASGSSSGSAGARTANPLVALTVLEVVYAYAHLLRAFNGDLSWDPLQCASQLLHLASSICSQRTFSSLQECLSASLSAAAALPGGGFGAALDERGVDDAAAILAGGSFPVGRALREAAALLRSSAEAAKEAGKSGHSRLLRGAKKLDFLVSFAFYHDEALRPLSQAAMRFAEERRKLQEATSSLEAVRGSDGGVALPSRRCSDDDGDGGGGGLRLRA